MTLTRLKGIICLAIPLMLAFASGDAAVASPAQSGQTVHVDGLDTAVQLPVVFPPVKKNAPNLDPTVQELRTRAETGNVDAMLAYANFLPPPSDLPWYLKAAEGGSLEAMMTVVGHAKAGYTGYGIDLPLSEKWNDKEQQTETEAISRKDAKVLRLMLKLYANSSNPDAAAKARYALIVGRAGGFEIGDGFDAVLAAFPHTPEKMQLLQRCSNDGHPWCTSQLAYDYLNGDDGLVLDHALGVKLLTKVAQAGYPLHYRGLSQAEQIQLWKTAIEHGAIRYAYFLAVAYRDGDGVPKSAPIAAALLQTSIQRPDLDGQTKGEAIWGLASMYVDGKSFPVNDQLFLSTLNLASSSGPQCRKTLTEWLLQTAQGLLQNDTLNITESTRLLLFKSVVEKAPPFNDADTYWQYLSAIKLGDLYSSGQKMKQSYADAMIWYQKAEQLGTNPQARDSGYDGVAAVKIGKLYEQGLGVPKDNTTANSWYQKAADYMIDHLGSPSGQPIENLMQLLNSVQLPKESVDRIISFIRSSAEADNVEAQYYLGQMYYDGKYVPQSYSEAVGWFEKCGNHSDIQYTVEWYRAAFCKETLGKMYMQGQGVMRDPAKAAQAFDNGLGRTEDVLLPMYCGGEEIPRDRPKAFALFKKDADRNFPFGELGVGAMYQMGWGVEQDLAEAFNWYRKAAADKNYSSAQAKADLTRIFRDCKGTPDNFNAAVSLYEKASGGQH